MGTPDASDLRIENDQLLADVSPRGGAVWRWHGKGAHGTVPLMREPLQTEERDPLRAACFPLVPFGNRVRANRFAFEGRTHTLSPNTAWDPHYLHGDGWTSLWTVAEHEADRVRLTLDHQADGTPYRYDAEQTIALDGLSLVLSLSVVNRGEEALPFGLGWHPYFPLAPDSVLQASAIAYWGEDRQWLPTERHPVLGDIDFGIGRPVPRRWMNTLFEGWDGRAAISWGGQRVDVRADEPFGRYLVFVSDPAFDPGYTYDFFCFEPMTHSADAHNRADGGGLRRLAPGESLAGSVRFTWSPPR